jgi:hypothetical protein
LLGGEQEQLRVDFSFIYQPCAAASVSSTASGSSTSTTKSAVINRTVASQ